MSKRLIALLLGCLALALVAAGCGGGGDNNGGGGSSSNSSSTTTSSHDVTNKSFKSGSAGGIEPGQSFKHKFAKAGTFKYVCTVHPGMQGTVVVK
jgi:copper binding plastocyanin/azurin family protein